MSRYQGFAVGAVPSGEASSACGPHGGVANYVEGDYDWTATCTDGSTCHGGAEQETTCNAAAPPTTDAVIACQSRGGITGYKAGDYDWTAICADGSTCHGGAEQDTACTAAPTPQTEAEKLAIKNQNCVVVGHAGWDPATGGCYDKYLDGRCDFYTGLPANSASNSYGLYNAAGVCGQPYAYRGDACVTPAGAPGTYDRDVSSPTPAACVADAAPGPGAMTATPGMAAVLTTTKAQPGSPPPPPLTQLPGHPATPPATTPPAPAPPASKWPWVAGFVVFALGGALVYSQMGKTSKTSKKNEDEDEG